jgi:fido (protein-threonine AMPylation protein)
VANPASEAARRHSIYEAVEIVDEPRSRAEIEVRNGLRQFDHGMGIIEKALEEDVPFRWRPSLIQALHREALQGISEFAGNWRPAGVSIGGSSHQPVAASLVPEQVEELCDYLNNHMADKSAVHLSAYTMWRLNWIHPFSDGNGRTSRIFSYIVLSVKFGQYIPGTMTIPDQIVANRKPYFEALESADKSWATTGNVDVSQMEILLERLLSNQLLSSIDHLSKSGFPKPASERNSEPLDSRPATFDFRVIDDVIDLAPETADSLDRETTEDLASEALGKTVILAERLEKTNVSNSFKQDLSRLSKRLSGIIRPGLILSSLRNVESYQYFYESPEGREEIPADAFRLLVDLCNTVRDLSATFPKSREIEAEAVSLQIPLDEENFAQILSLTENVDSVIISSDAASLAAKDALRETSVQIDSTQTLAQQAKQVSYHILDIDNFTRAGLRYMRQAGKVATSEAIDFGSQTYKSFKKDFTERAGKAASIAVLGGISGLMYGLGLEITALASMVGALTPLKNSIVSSESQQRPPTTGQDV